ncbi:MAG: MarR family transcriptional regulator [Candidatus Neomarinimicrobiota bacterium]|nr:MAG: MarR family transcriptional regulator [Candidatus Neomarinimicrobiota bacterium]
MEFGELLKHFLIDLQSLFRVQVTRPGMTLPQILLLSSIPDEGADMTTLARKLGVDNSTMTRLIGGLERRGWARRTKSEEDRRVSRVMLTERGEQLQTSIDRRIEVFGQGLLRSVPLENREEVREILLSLHWLLSKKNLERY